MWCKIMELNKAEKYVFVVVLSKYKGELLLSRHKERTTWETQGGHIEKGETPLEAAKRELFEESGAEKFSIQPIFDYESGDDNGSAAGMVFYAEIEGLGDIPQSEMAEVRSFSTLSENLTYSHITPKLFEKAAQMGLF